MSCTYWSAVRWNGCRLCQSAVLSAALSAGLLAGVATVVRADNWQLLETSEDGRSLSLETETIEINGDAVQFWAAIELAETTDFPDGLTIETQYSASCDSNRYRTERTLAYSGLGEVLYSSDEVGELKTAEPGTRMHTTIDVACAYGDRQAVD